VIYSTLINLLSYYKMIANQTREGTTSHGWEPARTTEHLGVPSHTPSY